MNAGFSQVIALGGTQGGLNSALLDHLRAEKVNEFVLCDGDQAGQ